MATHLGNGGIVEVASNTVAEVLNWSLTENAAIADDTVLGDSSKSHKNGGIKDWSGSVSCYWDETDASGQETMVVGASIVLHLLPDGSTTGDIDFNGTVTIVSIERSNPGNDSIVTANFTFTGNGDIVRTVLA